MFPKRYMHPTYQNRQQQSHVATTEDGEKDCVDHQQHVRSCQWGKQVDQATQDQVGFVEMVLVEKIPVCHPARGQLGDGLCDTCNRQRWTDNWMRKIYIYMTLNFDINVCRAIFDLCIYTDEFITAESVTMNKTIHILECCGCKIKVTQKFTAP